MGTFEYTVTTKIDVTSLSEDEIIALRQEIKLAIFDAVINFSTKVGAAKLTVTYNSSDAEVREQILRARKFLDDVGKLEKESA